MKNMLSSLLPTFLALNLGFASGFALQERDDGRSRAAYTLQNIPDGNFILAMAISAKDGTLSSPVKTDTQGKGLLGVNGGPDGLFGQGAVEVSRDVRITSSNDEKGNVVSGDLRRRFLLTRILILFMVW